MKNPKLPSERKFEVEIDEDDDVTQVNTGMFAIWVADEKLNNGGYWVCMCTNIFDYTVLVPIMSSTPEPLEKYIELTLLENAVVLEVSLEMVPVES